MTTTVLTMTLTGIAADSTIAGGGRSKLGRRSLAVAAMFVGALLVLHVDVAAPLAAAAAVLVVAAVATRAVSRAPAAWAVTSQARS